MIAICLAATVAPLLYALAITPPGRAFMWNNYLDSPDMYSYLAWMEQARQGHLLFVDRFTTELHSRLLFHPLFLAGGWLARLSGLPLAISYHLLRLAIAAACLVLVYRWIARYWDDTARRRLAFLLVVSSSGIGWLASALGFRSSDLGIPESITFMSLYQSPLFSASLACMVYVFSQFPTGAEPIRLRPVL